MNQDSAPVGEVVDVTLAEQLMAAIDADAVFCISCGQPDEPALHDPARCPAQGGVADALPIASALELYDQSCEIDEDIDPDARALHCAMLGYEACLSTSIAIPAGYALVPIEPVDAMLDAAVGVDFSNEDERGSACNLWYVMLAATPEPPAATEAETGVREAAYVAGPVFQRALDEGDEGPIWEGEIQISGGHYVVAEVYGSSKEEVFSRQDAILAALATPIAAHPEPDDSIAQVRGIIAADSDFADQLRETHPEPVPDNEVDERGEAMICAGCGTTRSIAGIKRRSTTAFSCCPERKMIPARTMWNAYCTKNEYVPDAGVGVPIRRKIAKIICDNHYIEDLEDGTWSGRSIHHGEYEATDAILRLLPGLSAETVR